MTGRATITFSQVGVQPPIYVVTSLSEPQWATLEMAVSGERTESGDPVYSLHFEGVAEGSYQYKIRIGEGFWVVDESKETAIDNAGNRNNVVHTESTIESYGIRSAPDATATESRGDAGPAEALESDAAPQDQQNNEKEEAEVGQERQDSTQLPLVPLPFVVVDKVKDQAQPDYGDVEPEKLAIDTSKRAADADPDYESVKSDTTADSKEQLEEPMVPVVVVEKTDSKPSFGDDFGEDATFAQKIAHDSRMADATPDHVVVQEKNTNTDDYAEPDLDVELNAPLFDHEAFDSEDTSSVSEHSRPFPQSGSATLIVNPVFVQYSHITGRPRRVSHPLSRPSPPPMDTIPEESSQSSIALNSNGSATNGYHTEEGDDLLDQTLERLGVPDTSEIGTSDELGQGPLLSHETEPASSSGGSVEDSTTQQSSDAEHTSDENEDNDSEPSQTPLMSQEIGSASESTGLLDLSERTDSNEPEETPLLSPETEATDEGANLSELDHAPLLSHETSFEAESERLGELDNVPLMSHETSLSESGLAGSVSNVNTTLTGEGNTSDNEIAGGTFGLDRVPTFSYENLEDAGGEHSVDHDVPLLPHERLGGASEGSASEGARSESGALPLSQGNDSLFSGARAGSFLFEHRSHSSSLPHSLPRSDAEDQNLHDPSLEPFPTGRDPIMRRIATIEQQYPEDETVDPVQDTHSPGYTVLSQACSSVDLPPVGSYASLRDAHREALLEEDEEEDATSLGSPPLELASRVGASSQQANPNALLKGDELATPMAQDKRVELPNEEVDTKAGAEAGAQTFDGTSAGTKSIAASAKVLEPLNAPSQAAATKGGKLRKRFQSAPTPDQPGAAPSINEAPAQSRFKDLLEKLFAPLRRALTACLGREKNDTAPTWFWLGLIVLGVAVAWTFLR